MCVEEVAVEYAFGSAVEGVANHRVADAREMHANLMGAAGTNANPQIGKSFVASDYFVIGQGSASCGNSGSHFCAMDGIAGDGRLNTAAIGFDGAVDNGEVDLLNGTAGELLREALMSGIGACDEEHAAGVAVEPVDDAGMFVTAHGRE